MNTVFGFIIWFSLISVFFGLFSMVTTKTVFFLPNPTHTKGLVFWLGSSFVGVACLVIMRAIWG